MFNISRVHKVFNISSLSAVQSFDNLVSRKWLAIEQSETDKDLGIGGKYSMYTSITQSVRVPGPVVFW